MSCDVKQNSIEHMQNKGYIDDNMFVSNAMFYSENDRLSSLAKDKYLVNNKDKLFTTERTASLNNIKAIPNNEFFIELQDNKNKINAINEAFKSVKERETDLGIDKFGDSIGREYQKQSYINENLKESEFAIRDLAARMVVRIGGNVRFISDLTKDYSGYNEGNTSVINLAKATLDTPIHEIIAHPIIRAIKNRDVKEVLSGSGDMFSKNFSFESSGKLSITGLYKNLLKELETDYGKEVLNRVKKEYDKRESNQFSYDINGNLEEGIKYSLEEQQEEALVQLLGEYTAGKIKETKENKGLITFLKQLLAEMTTYMRSLFNSKEIQINKLSADMTINDLSNLLAFTNSKIILPGNSIEYTTPDNNKFSTYQEASNHVSKLFKESKDVDLTDLSNNKFKGVKDVFNNKIIKNIQSSQINTSTEFLEEEGFNIAFSRELTINYEDGTQLVINYNDINPDNFTKEESDFYSKLFNETNNNIKDFIEKNKQFEQSKEIIDTWKKENNIRYNPEEVYSRGQGFYSSIGAYSTIELDLLLQNLLQHIEDNKKAGGQFAISAFTKPVDKRIEHLEKESSVRFVMYPKSEDILWAAPIDVYSGSVWDAGEKVSKDKKSELLGVSHTKAPSLNNINKLSPNLASIIDERNHHHNELGIELTPTNFRMEADDNVSFEIKKLVNSINSILDQKYGKIVKPEIKNNQDKKVYNVTFSSPNDELSVNKNFDTYNEAQDFIRQNLDDMVGFGVPNAKNIKPLETYINIGIQPTQTKENTTSIEDSAFKVANLYYEGNTDGSKGGYYMPMDDSNKKEYTSQASINTKIAALKEVAKAQPRSLIVSKVINNQKTERQYQQSLSQNGIEEQDKQEITNITEEDNQQSTDNQQNDVNLQQQNKANTQEDDAINEMIKNGEVISMCQ